MQRIGLLSLGVVAADRSAKLARRFNHYRQSSRPAKRKIWVRRERTRAREGGRGERVGGSLSIFACHDGKSSWKKRLGQPRGKFSSAPLHDYRAATRRPSIILLDIIPRVSFADYVECRDSLSSRLFVIEIDIEGIYLRGCIVYLSLNK